MKRILAAAALAAISPFAWAADCAIDIGGDDMMKFSVDHIDVSAACAEFTVNLTHTGKLARNVMGHNWVLSKTTDFQAIATDGMRAGLDNDHIQPGDNRVIAHTSVIGAGEKTSVTFPVGKLSAGEDYTFFCSFPGHWALMKGTLRLVD